MGDWKTAAKKRWPVVVIAVMGVLAAAGAVWALAATTVQYTTPAAATRTAAPARQPTSPSTASRSPAPTIDIDLFRTPTAPPRTSAPPPKPTMPAQTQAAAVQPPPRAPRPAWTPTQTVCPAGKVTARVDRLDRVQTYDWADDYYAVTVHGTLTNGTTDRIRIYRNNTPEVVGLDGAGNKNDKNFSYGEYAQSPAPGRPKADYVFVEPGASIAFSAGPRSFSVDELKAIQYWYTETADPSVGMLNFAEDPISYSCKVGRDAAGEGQSLPNPYR